MIDLSGRVVMEVNVGRSSNVITIPERLKAGTYLLRLQGDTIRNHKIVVQ